MNNKDTAIIVVDVVNEFVNGKVKSENAKIALPFIKDLIDFAHTNNYQVIFANDMHDIYDMEIKVWGPHSLRGDKASQIIDDIEVSKNDIVIEKHTYSAFYKTSLDEELQKRSIKNVIICGLYLNICIKYTVINAFNSGYNVILAKQATTAFESSLATIALDEIKLLTNTKLLDNDNIKKLLDR